MSLEEEVSDFVLSVIIIRFKDNLILDSGCSHDT